MMFVHFVFFLGVFMSIALILSTSDDDYENLKYELYKDDEDLRETTSIQTSLTPITNFSYTYRKNVLNVSFYPAYIGSRYWIRLIDSDNGNEMPKMITASQPLEVVTFGTDDVIPYRNYTIEIRDILQGKSFKSEEFYLGAYKTAFLDCNQWNARTGLHADSREYTIIVFLDPWPEFTSCFEIYVVDLFKSPNPVVYQRKEVNYNNHEMEIHFTNLSQGNYYIQVTPNHNDCPHNKCSVRQSNPRELKEYKDKQNDDDKQNKNGDDNSVIVAVASCIVMLVTCIGIIGAIMKVIKRHNPTYQISTINSLEEKVPSDDPNCKDELYIKLLHGRDTEKQQKVLMALNDFCQECCHANSVTAENNAEVLMNSAGWIQNNFDYSVLKNGKGTKNNNIKYKILIVETDATVKLYEEFCKNKQPAYQTYHHLNYFFTRGMAQLLTNTEFHGGDNKHIVVIHFSYFTKKLSCFLQKRIYLPSEVVELYNSLWDRKNLYQGKEKLLNEWKHKESYKKLLSAIKEMEEYVNKNPDYLNKYVFGDSEVA